MAADAATMRAIAVRPGVADSLHARDVRRPGVDDVPNERLLTTPVSGLGDPAALLVALEDEKTIKAHVEIAAPSAGGAA